LYEFKKLIKRV